MSVPAAIVLLGLECLFPCAGSLLQGVSEQTSESLRSESAVVLRQMIAVPLKLAEDIDTKTAKEGQGVEFVLAEDLKVGETIVARVGSRAIGKVVRSRGPDLSPGLGPGSPKPNQLGIQVTFLRVGNTKVQLRGGARRLGKLDLLFPVGQAVIQRGTPVTAYVDADTEVPTPDTQSGPAPAASNRILLPDRTPVELMLVEPISSQTAKAGDPVKLQVFEEVRIGDLVVIAHRAPASGSVVEVRGARRAWRSGGITIRLNSVKLVNGAEQRLQLQRAFKGESTHAAEAWTEGVFDSQGLALLALPLAPLQHGKQAVLRRGRVVEAVTDGEVSFDRTSLEAVQPVPTGKRTGPASVTVYYANVGAGSGSIDVWCGAVKVAKLRKDRKFTMNLPAGTYWLRTLKRDPGIRLDVEEGADHYVSVQQYWLSSSSPTWRHYWALALSVVDHDVGEVEAAGLALSDAKDQQDVSQLDLAQLQAMPPGK